MSESAKNRINDFVIKLANVNGTGSASANALLMKADLPHGHPGRRQEFLPVQHPGPADLVRDPRQQGRLSRALRPGRHHGRDERRRPTRRTSRRSRPAATLRLRLDLAARASLSRPDVTDASASRSRGWCNERLRQRARAHPDEEHGLRRRAGRAASTRHGRGPPAHRGDLRRASPSWSPPTCRRSSSATITRRSTSTARCRSRVKRHGRDRRATS